MTRVSFSIREGLSTERALKLGIIAWSVAALAVEIWLLRGAWPNLPAISLVVCAAVALLSAFDRRFVSIVLALSYVLPALIYLRVGHYYPQYSAVWMALLLAAILPASVSTGWHIPSPWRGALVCWSLVAIAGATIVALREIDFTPALFGVTTIANTAGGGWPAFIIRFVLHVGLVTTIGILWFDWLWTTADMHFDRVVAIPLAFSALVLGVVSVYQLFFDISFLNATVYGNLKRASGTVFDANVNGTLTALWLGGAALVAQRHPAAARYLIPVATIVGWLAVWATGSRTGFAAAAIVTAFNVTALAGSLRGMPRMRAVVAAALVFAAGAAATAILARADLGVVGPMARFRSTVPDPTAKAIKAELYEQLWNRNGFGGASTAMIARFPWFGVGVGSFQSMLPEFPTYGGRRLPPDNAQNWYRHQLAELGIIGSLPWLAWVVAFGWHVLDIRRARAPSAWISRGILVAFAAVSFVGMPGQEPIVAVTFWTFAFWFASIAGVDDVRPWPRRLLAVLAAVVVLFAVGTVHAARTDLRVPVRAQRVGWPYSYGFLRPGANNFGAGPGWTGRQAVAVFQPQSEWVEVTVSADYRAVPGAPLMASTPVATRPTQMKLRCNGELILDTRLTTTAPVTAIVRTDWRHSWLLLESEVSRVVPLRQLGLDDDREVGVRLEWRGTQAPSGDRLTHTCGREISDPPPVTVTSLGSNTVFPSPVFVPITWTAQASGGRGPLLYQFWRLKQGTGWTVVRDYSQENTLTWTPIAGDTGSYVLQVWVKASGSQNAFDAWGGMAFTITSPAPAR